MTLSQDVINLVDFPLPPAGWETRTHRRDAGRAIGLEGCIALLLPADEAARLVREVVEGADERVEALAEMGGI